MPWYLAVLASGVMLYAAGSDVTRYRIPNACVLALAGVALAHAAIQGDFSVVGGKGALAVFLPGCLLFHCNAIGGGDVKLAAACLLLLPGRLWSFLFFMSVLGGLLGLGYLARRLLVKSGTSQIPYGVAIAGAALIELYDATATSGLQEMRMVTF